jgi:ABC-type Fe3+-hydroxamate transport system substrate-binding protein
MKRLRTLALAVSLGALALTGCSTGSTDDDAATTGTKAEAGAFPVSIKHAFGETTVEKAPTRVATVGWTDQDMAAALGVVPVGATKMTWGGNAQGSSDWFDAKVKDLGAKAPARYDDTDGIPFDEIAKTSPDLILATNSGITKEDYAKLTKIAPVVAYPGSPWVTPWRTSLETVGKALGRSAEAKKLEEKTDDEIASAKKEYPDLEGKSVIFSFLTTTDLSSVGVYGSQDPRVAILRDFGMKDAPAVTKYVKSGEFYGTVSAERASQLTSDVFLTYAENEKDMKTFTDNPLIGKIPALADGHAFGLVDKNVGLAVTNPSPLSVPYIVDNFLPDVSKAAQGS